MSLKVGSTQVQTVYQHPPTCDIVPEEFYYIHQTTRLTIKVHKTTAYYVMMHAFHDLLVPFTGPISFKKMKVQWSF